MTDSTVEGNGPQRTINLVVTGDGAVGKTSLLTLYCEGIFPLEYVPTIFDNFTKNTHIPEIGNVLLKLADTYGSEDYDRLRPLSYIGANVMLICFSIASPASLNNVETKWIQEVRHHLPDVPVVLVGCQTDLRDDLYTTEQLESRGYQGPCSFEEGKIIALKIGVTHYVECSSLTGDGVTVVFETAIRAAVQAPVRKQRRHRKGAKCVIF
ncbi:small GTPase Cdc42 [Flagelloscypha sp. PMI_526]|nr:small GTPase Cdc42 [Flagelloscypha sp. PMI_526]